MLKTKAIYKFRSTIKVAKIVFEEDTFTLIMVNFIFRATNSVTVNGPPLSAKLHASIKLYVLTRLHTSIKLLGMICRPKRAY